MDALSSNDADLAPPFTLSESGSASPIIVASPHSGRDYTDAFLAASRLDALALRQTEDSYVDELLADAPALGIPLLAATFPRTFCDVNRENWELDPDMFVDRLPGWCNTGTARVAAGHGTIPRTVGAGERIYGRKLRFEEAAARIRTCWEPYHQALGALLARTRARHGRCLLLDCHSMPREGGARAADFVLGDGHGTSCAAPVVDAVEACLVGRGYRVRRNDPYAGGFVTRHYGRPAENTHVLQVEMSRGLYLDERVRGRSAGFAALRVTLAALLAALVARPDLPPVG